MEIFYLENGNIKYLDDRDARRLFSIPRDVPVWIRLKAPDDRKIETASKYSNIPIDEFKDFLEDEERSRVEHGRFLDIVYRAPVAGSSETTSFAIFYSRHLFITIERTKIDVIDRLSSSLKRGKLRFLFKKSPGNFINYILEKINDQFLASIEKIGREARKTSIDDSDQEKRLTKLYEHSVTLSHFNNALLSNLEVLNALKKSHSRLFTKEDIELFTDLYYEILQVIDTEKIQRDVLSSLFNFQTVLESHKLNILMKRLTSITLIIAIPTLISSIYGMNVKLPLAGYAQAFTILMWIMLFISLISAFILWKLDWL